jgi:hypothetical protein
MSAGDSGRSRPLFEGKSESVADINRNLEEKKSRESEAKLVNPEKLWHI